MASLVADGALAGLLSALQRWTDLTDGQRPGWRSMLQAPLPPSHIREVLADLGLAPSTELLAWYAWADGSSTEWDSSELSPTSYQPLPLAEAVTVTVTVHHEMVAHYEQHRVPDLRYRRSWFPIAQAGSYRVLAVDLTDPLADASPLLATEVPAHGPWSMPVLPSVAALVEAWTTAITTGYWHFSPDDGEGQYGPLDMLPPSLRRLIVV